MDSKTVVDKMKKLHIKSNSGQWEDYLYAKKHICIGKIENKEYMDRIKTIVKYVGI